MRFTINSGKKFEQDFKASVPPNVWYYRFRDGTANYSGGTNENVRFQQSNIADCMIFGYEKLFICELKSHKGKSIPFNCIRENQIEQMQKAAKFDGIIPLMIIHFADIERTFSVHINDFCRLMSASEKKSANIAEIESTGIEIAARKLKVNYRYDLEEFLKRWQ